MFKIFKILNILKNHVLAIRDFLIDLIFPVECLGCSEEGSWVCGDCFLSIKLNSTEVCTSCGKPNKFGENCHQCKDKYYFNGLLPAAFYTNEFLEKILRTHKYKFIRKLKDPLGKIMLGYLRNYLERINIYANQGKSISPFLDSSDLIIMPVPLSKKRFQWRGFNQTTELAKIVANKYNFKLDDSSLIRTKNNRPQAKLPTKLRQNNIKDSFAWTGARLDNKNIFLIDDVSTSGSTLNECARVLKNSGAKKVWCLVVAKG